MMYSRVYLKRQNKKLKTINIILTLVIVAMGLIILHEVRNDDEVWNEGFTSCIEENNLYNKYPTYEGDGRWAN